MFLSQMLLPDTEYPFPYPMVHYARQVQKRLSSPSDCPHLNVVLTYTLLYSVKHAIRHGARVQPTDDLKLRESYGACSSDVPHVSGSRLRLFPVMVLSRFSTLTRHWWEVTWSY